MGDWAEIAGNIFKSIYVLLDVKCRIFFTMNFVITVKIIR